jgi:hypothetical protein
MRAHPHNATIQQYSAIALRNMTMHAGSSKDALAAQGGLAALLDAMRVHPFVDAVLCAHKIIDFVFPPACRLRCSRPVPTRYKTWFCIAVRGWFFSAL